MHQGQETVVDSAGAKSLIPSTPTRTTDDGKTSLTSSPSSPRSPGTRAFPQKPPIHPRRASQTSSIKSTSSPPRDIVVPTTPPSPSMISPMANSAVKSAEASVTRKISTSYRPYLPHSSSSSSQTSARLQSQTLGSGAPPAPSFAKSGSSSKLTSIKGFIAEKGASHRPHIRSSPAAGAIGHGLYSAYSTTTSASTSSPSGTTTSGSTSTSTSQNISSAQTPMQPQWDANSNAYGTRQSWRSWATDKIGAASAKVQAGAAVVASSAAAWKDSRDSRDGPPEDYPYYNHHTQNSGYNSPSVGPGDRRYQRRGSKDTNSSYNGSGIGVGDEKLDVASGLAPGSSPGASGASNLASASGCATAFAPGGILETLHLFPGWGVRRYRPEPVHGDSPKPFDIELYISGFAISSKTPETASRSQRAFVRLAKGFASLPKLPIIPSVLPDLANAAANAMSPGPTPPPVPPKPKRKALPGHQDEAGTEDAVPRIELDGGIKEKGKAPQDDDSDAEARMRDELHDVLFHPNGSTPASDHQHNNGKSAEPSSEDLQNALLTRLHENLERRLMPFWSSVMSNRTVKIAIWLGKRGGDVHGHGDRNHPHHIPDRFKNAETDEAEEAELLNPPLVQVTVQTATDGSFTARIWVSWEELCVHPKGVHIAFGESSEGVREKELQEHEVEIWVEMPNSNNEMLNTGDQSQLVDVAPVGGLPHSRSAPSLPLSPTTPNASASSSALPSSASSSTQSIPRARNQFSTLRTHVAIPITHSPIRLLSDIDDTVKAAGVISGARAIFHNVFVKDLKDIVIPGMGEWYAGMWSLGVRFHYVSNGPFEMLPVVNEFFQMAQLPPGSIKLRSYAGRSLFNGLLSAPAARKRQGVIDVLESFKDSKFFLVGDTGEQDLELYAEMARERPHQILAVFVRDVMADTYRPDEAPSPIDDPTGWGVYGVGRAVTPTGPGLESPQNATLTRGLSVHDEVKTAEEAIERGEEVPRYLTTSPTQEFEDAVDASVKGTRDTDETPKPNKFISRFEDSPAIGLDVTSSGDIPGDSPVTLSDFSAPNRRRGSHENASMVALVDGVLATKPQTPTRSPTNPRSSATTRLKEALVGSRPGSRSSTRSGSGIIDKPPTATAPPMIPNLMRAGSVVGAAIARPNMNAAATDFFTPNDRVAMEYETDSDGSTMSSTESASTSSAEWGQSQWRGGKRRVKKKLGLSRSTGSRSSGGSAGWRATVSRRSTGGSGGYGGAGNGNTGPMSEVEKKRAELQGRVYRARTIMPSGVPLRIFRDPMECVETEDILKREGMA